jgi:hypothetical protein
MTDLRDHGKVVMGKTLSSSSEWVRTGRRGRRLAFFSVVEYANRQHAKLEVPTTVPNGTPVKVIYDPKNVTNVRAFTTKAALDWDATDWGWRLAVFAVLLGVGTYWVFAAFAGLRRRRVQYVVHGPG